MTRPSENSTQVIKYAVIILYAWLAVGEILLALNVSPSADDAMFLSVPKNWLNHYGWATSYSDKIPFNPDLTAGPTLLLPAALLIKCFGNQLWIAGITGVAINLTLIALCLWQLRQHTSSTAVAPLLFLTACILIKGEDIHSLIGYYSASLLFFLAVFIGVNQQYDIRLRASLISLCAAATILTKQLALPGFLLISVFFIGRELRLTPSRQKKITALCLLSLPVTLTLSSWHVYISHELAQYSDTYQSVWHSYRHNFFINHGSGTEQFFNTPDKLNHLSRNTNKNLYFIEDALREFKLYNPLLNAPADENHFIGILFVFALILICLVSRRKPSSAYETSIAIISASALLYLTWFLTIAMAMSPGHAYFPIQFGITAILLFLATLPPLVTNKNITGVTAVTLLLVLVFCLKPTMRNRVFLLQHDNTPQSSTMLQASRFLQSRTFQYPLAGCGYAGYPRHIEYLFPDSQNFQDCYDMIEDHVALDEDYYFSHNTVDRTHYKTALEHFHAFIGRAPLDYRFYWTGPVNFTLVTSLQSPDFSSYRIKTINQACGTDTLYRNDDVLITQCTFEKLKTMDLNFMMSEIAINQRWYKTRLNPYEGKHFPTLKAEAVAQ